MENSTVIFKRGIEFRDVQDDDEIIANKRSRLSFVKKPKIFHVGINKYEIKPKTSVNILMDYMQFVMGSGYSEYSNSVLGDKYNQTVIIRVLTQMFYAIMTFNNVLCSDNFACKILEDDTFPDFLVYDHQNQTFIISINYIIDYLQLKVEGISITVDANFSCVQPNNNLGESIERGVYEYLRKLFVIVDHCATHCFDYMTTGATDIFCHESFGENNFVTMATMMKIELYKKQQKQSQQNPITITSTYKHQMRPDYNKFLQNDLDSMRVNFY